MKKNTRIKYPKSNKFSAITFQEYPNLKFYDSIQINVKTKDKKIFNLFIIRDYLFCEPWR